MTRLLPILLFSVFFSGTKAQSTAPESADLNSSNKISVNSKYMFSSSPKGFGTLQEFPRNPRRSEHYIEQERNTIWLTMEIPFSGTLTFEISPHSIADDYDWMLFENNAQLKDGLKKGKITLLRSNNSRNDPSILGKTGIKEGAFQLFESPGPGRSYSKALMVKKGQKLALIIDNIYDGGAGFDFISELKPKILSYRTLKGVVLDRSTKLPIKAEVICEDDSTGVQVGKATCGQNGNFSIQVPVERAFNLTAQREGYTFQSFDIPAQNDSAIQNFELLPLAETDKLVLFNIHFTPDKDVISANSEPELQRLIELLKIQNEWAIRVVGHTNNNPFADARYLQKLSFNRAISVKQYLIKNGISEKRISCAGLGGKKPLVITKNVEEGLVNLRVEVVVSRK